MIDLSSSTKIISDGGRTHVSPNRHPPQSHNATNSHYPKRPLNHPIYSTTKSPQFTARNELDARFLLFLSALCLSSVEIERQRRERHVVVDSYLARTVAYHQGMGSAVTVSLPGLLEPDLTFYLECGEQVRQQRLRQRGGPRNYWDRLAERHQSSIRASYRHFGMHTVDTTTRTVDETVQSILEHPLDGNCGCVKNNHVWQATRTFFPLFTCELRERQADSVCVVGASDGKYVIPLAAEGYHVVAVERDRRALHGGTIQLPGGVPGQMLGLRERLTRENLGDRVQIVEADLLDTRDLAACDAVWTSCSWHYSINHSRPLNDFIERLQACCRLGGLLGAEFMMPVEPRQLAIEHYLDEGQIRRYFSGWKVFWELYSTPFVEEPHVDQLEPHAHRMGLILAQRPDICWWLS